MIDRLIDISVSHQVAVLSAIALVCVAGVFTLFVAQLLVYPVMCEVWNSRSCAGESDAALELMSSMQALHLAGNFKS